MAIPGRFHLLPILAALAMCIPTICAQGIRAETNDRSRIVAQAATPARPRAAQPAGIDVRGDSKTTRPAAVTERRPAAATERLRRMPMITPAREAAALAFVKANHPELFDLLASLRADQPEEYDKALRDLFRVSERLAQTNESDTSRYELELNLWKAQSQIELLTAQIRMSDSPQLRGELRQTLRDRVGLQKMLYEHERSRLAERLERVSQNIERFEKQGDQMVDRQLDALLRSTTPKPKRDAP